MRYLRQSLLVAFILSFALAAGANTVTDMRIIFDPALPLNPVAPLNLYQLNSPGVQYGVTWLNCSAYSWANPAPTFDACLGFLNNTGPTPLSEFDISFTVPSSGPGSSLIGQPLTCTTQGSNLSSNTCPSGNLTAGQNVDVSFFGGTPIPNETAFFVGETGVACANASGSLDCTNLPTFQVIDPAPEPSTLLLALLGLSVAGFAWAWRRRREEARSADLRF